MNCTEEIGCCGAYCGTCREFEKTCKGCKPGYLDGSRDLNRARCKMKKCCLTKGTSPAQIARNMNTARPSRPFSTIPATNTPNTSRHWSSSAPTATLPF